MSARALLAERGRIRREYDQALAVHRTRLQQLGLTAEKFIHVTRSSSLDPAGLVSWWQELTGSEDALSRRVRRTSPSTGRSISCAATPATSMSPRGFSTRC